MELLFGESSLTSQRALSWDFVSRQEGLRGLLCAYPMAREAGKPDMMMIMSRFDLKHFQCASGGCVRIKLEERKWGWWKIRKKTDRKHKPVEEGMEHQRKQVK